MYERFSTHFAARDWDAMAELLADDISTRRSPSGRERRDPARSRCRNREHAKPRRPRCHDHNVDAIATRGERSSCAGHSGRDQQPEEFHTEILNVVEIDADERIAASVGFDPDDIDAAFAELDARYLAGEAAAHAHTWSVIAGVYAAFNRRDFRATTPDWVNIDHRRGRRSRPAT